MSYQIRLFLLAVQFFTRVPITGRLAAWVGFTPMMLRESAAYFPLVGAAVGAVAAGVMLAALALFGPAGHGPLLASGLSLAATLLLTGAFHEDGLADVADGLGGSLQREKALEIMKDSRIGTFGTVALICVTLLKVVAVAEISPLEEPDAEWALLALLVSAHVISRCAALCMIAWLPHVEGGGASKSKPLADRIDPKALSLAFLTCFLCCVPVFIYFDATHLIVFVLWSALVVLALGRWFRRRVGGFTGDCLGTVQQVSELGIYLCAAALLA